MELRLGSKLEVRGATGWTPASVVGAVCPGRFRVALVGAETIEVMSDEERLRPAPPAAGGEDYVTGLADGAAVEAYVAGSWQRASFSGAKMQRLESGARHTQCSVEVGNDGAPSSVSADEVRPCWEWSAAGGWQQGSARPDDPAPAASEATAMEAAEPAAPASAATTNGVHTTDDGQVAGASEEPVPPPPPSGADAATADAGGEMEQDDSAAAPAAVEITVGAEMELTSFEDGLKGSWYAVRVEEVGCSDGTVRVQYTAEGYGEERAAPERLRPPPPPLSAAPTGWASRLRSGELVQLSYEHGWWDVKFVRRSGSEFTVLAATYNITHVVGKARLRPCWLHDAAAEPPKQWRVVAGGKTYFYDASRGVSVEAAALAAAAAGDAGGDAAAADGSAQGEGGGALAPAAEEEPEEEEEETEEELLAGFKWGMAVECTSSDEGLQGCWCPAEVLQVQAEARQVRRPPLPTRDAPRPRSTRPPPPPSPLTLKCTARVIVLRCRGHVQCRSSCSGWTRPPTLRTRRSPSTRSAQRLRTRPQAGWRLCVWANPAMCTTTARGGRLRSNRAMATSSRSTPCATRRPAASTARTCGRGTCGAGGRAGGATSTRAAARCGCPRAHR